MSEDKISGKLNLLATQIEAEQTLLSCVDEVFEETPVDFIGNHGIAGAEAAIQKQQTLRIELIRIARKSLMDGGWLVSGSRALEELTAYLDSSPSLFGAFKTSRLNSTDAQVVGPCPFISEEKVNILKKKIDDSNLIGRSQNELAGYIIANLLDKYSPVAGRNAPQLDELSPIVSLGMAWISVRKMSFVPQKSIDYDKEEKYVLELQQQVARYASDAGKVHSMYMQISDGIVKLAEQPRHIADEIRIYRDEANNAISALKEQIGMNETKKLWSAQALKGTRAYFASLILIMLLLIGTPIMVWINVGDLIEYISGIEKAFLMTGDYSAAFAAVGVTSRLLLITAPFALLIWAIRLLVRYNVRSMLLMDDASQRVTMLNTYLFLVDKGAATIQDRGALLEAMFRRAPGHGPETIEPPNLTDVMKYGETMRESPR